MNNYSDILDKFDEYNEYIYTIEKSINRFYRNDILEIVIDNQTNLMWQDNSSREVKNIFGLKKDYIAISWDEANKYIKNLNKIQFAGYNDWRLPMLHELYSIINFSNKKGSIAHPTYGWQFLPQVSWNKFKEFKNISSPYWSSTSSSFSVDICSGVSTRIPYYLKDFGRVIGVRGELTSFKELIYNRKKEVVLDINLNIMWQGNDEEKNISKSYKEVSLYIQNINKLELAGYDNWRLPTIQELIHLFYYANSSMIILDNNHFEFNYLTSTFSTLKLNECYTIQFTKYMELNKNFIGLIKKESINTYSDRKFYIKLVRTLNKNDRLKNHIN